MKNKNTRSLLIRCGISFVLLGVLFWVMRNNLSNIFGIIRMVKIHLFLFVLPILMLVMIISGLRLKVLFAVQEINFSTQESIKLVLMGMFFNNFMPSTIGGDVIKLYYARKRSDNLIKPFSALLIDRIVGLMALVFVAITALLLGGYLIKNLVVKWIVVALFISAFIIIILFLSDAVRRKVKFLLSRLKFKKLIHNIEKVYKTIALFRGTKQLKYAFLFAILIQLLMPVLVYVLTISLSIKIPFGVFFIFIPIIAIVSSLPSLNGLGIREGAFLYFFKSFIEPEQAFAISILYLSQLMLISIIGGIIYLISGSMNKKGVFDAQ